MDFAEAQAQLQRLREQWQGGQISPQEFAAEVNHLQVQDVSGQWWQPNPSGQGWLRWDGSQWEPATPPLPGGPPPAAPSAGEVAGSGPGPEWVATLKAYWATLKSYWPHFRSRLMDPKDFLETSRQVSWSQRPQSWWNALSIGGGAASGYLWFVYSSVRGLPRLKFLGAGRESWLDLLPALILLAIPILLIIGRRTVLKTVQPWGTSLMGMPAAAKLALGAAVLLFLALINTNNPILGQREGLDFITPLLMTAIPALLVWFRGETDRILAPIQPWRQKIPKLVLIGVSLAIPFLTAYVFYRWMGINQYPLLRLNVVVGTLLSYALLRTPGSQTGSHPLRPGVATLGLLLLGLYLLMPELAWADDFLRDPFNLRDGLRTNGIAPVLAGISTLVVSILVNGVEVAKVMIQDTKPVEEGEEAQHKKFLVVVNTGDKQGNRSTTLDQMANDTIFCYAHCEEEGKGRFPAGDATLNFALTSAAAWVVLKDLGTQHRERCARLTFVSPLPEGKPPETASILVSAGVDALVSASVDINLVCGIFVLEVF